VAEPRQGLGEPLWAGEIMGVVEQRGEEGARGGELCRRDPPPRHPRSVRVGVGSEPVGDRQGLVLRLERRRRAQGQRAAQRAGESEL